MSYEGRVTNISGIVADRGRGDALAAEGGAPLSHKPEKILPWRSGVGW